jgi:hypothetical protein
MIEDILARSEFSFCGVRFQAKHSNDCWQFDLSPSDLKEIKDPSGVSTPNSSIRRIASPVDRCRPFLFDVRTLMAAMSSQ